MKSVRNEPCELRIGFLLFQNRAVPCTGRVCMCTWLLIDWTTMGRCIGATARVGQRHPPLRVNWTACAEIRVYVTTAHCGHSHENRICNLLHRSLLLLVQCSIIIFWMFAMLGRFSICYVIRPICNEFSWCDCRRGGICWWTRKKVI